MRTRYAASSLCLILLAACDRPAPAPDKEELTRRLHNSRTLPPETRIALYCEDRVSNLCDKLRAEPKYRDSWLKAMDGIADTRAKAAHLLKEIEEKKAKLKAEYDKMIANAFKLKDGRPVFGSEKGGGKWITEDNQVVPLHVVIDSLGECVAVHYPNQKAANECLRRQQRR